MRLRTKMVGATALALLGLTLAVQHWAEGPLPQRPFRGPTVQVRPTPLPDPLPSPSARTAGTASPTPPTAHALPPAAAPAAASEGLAPARDTGGSGHAPPLPSEGRPASPPPDAATSDEAARREVRALVLAAARELAAKPPAATASPGVSAPPREAAELQRVPLEAGLPRVELDEAGERVAPIDLSTGAGLEVSPPPPEAAAQPPHEAELVDPEPVLDEPVEGESGEGESGEGESGEGEPEADEGFDEPESGPEDPLQQP